MGYCSRVLWPVEYMPLLLERHNPFDNLMCCTLLKDNDVPSTVLHVPAYSGLRPNQLDMHLLSLPVCDSTQSVLPPSIENVLWIHEDRKGNTDATVKHTIL